MQLDESDIFEVARTIPDENARKAYLGQVCGDRTALMARVEALLEAHQADPDYLSIDASTADTMDLPSGPAEQPGQEIGPYKLLEQIGEGGFGMVYVAEQERPVRRKVALKVIKPGMDSKEVIARFEAERQALALMDHPNIAKVFDAGTTEAGRPYFVMELVRGIPITDYCNKKRLNTKQRLELFVSVCQAMQHAHQKGVIHRDVKPSNVMITEHDGTPVPKVIDFGVAKAIHQRLTEHTIYTRHQQIVGTPLYMSPEQAELSAFDVDTRTDIYSLGVLLYELLTGTTPIDRQRLNEAAYDEIRRIIREEDPPKPSTRVSTMGPGSVTDDAMSRPEFRRLGSVLRGDLDWIVMKSLEKDRSRRYETASSFADDIKRHLENEPVLASPPSVTYRLGKFIRKRKGLVVATTAVAASLIVGLTASIYQSLAASEAAKSALASEQKARASEQRALAAQKETERAWTSSEEEKSKAQEAKLQAEAMATEADLARKKAEKDSAISDELFQMMRAMLTSTNSYRRSQSGRFSSYLPSDTTAKGYDYTVRQMLDEFSLSLRERQDVEPEIVGRLWNTIGNAYNYLGDFRKSRDAFSRAIDAGSKLRKDAPLELAGYLYSSTYALIFAGFQQMALNAPFAEGLMQDAIAIRKDLERTTGKDGPPQHYYLLLAYAQGGGGNLESAEATLAEGAREWRKATGQDGWNAAYYSALAGAINLNTHDRADEVIDNANKSLALLSQKPKDENHRIALIAKANALLGKGELLEADRTLVKFGDDFVAEPGFPTENVRTPSALYVSRRARTLVGTGRRSEAYRILEGTLESCKALPVPAREIQFRTQIADHQCIDGEFSEAVEHLKTAARVALQTEGMGPQDILYSDTLLRLAIVNLLQEDSSNADLVLEQLLPFAKNGVEQTDRNTMWLHKYAFALALRSSATEEELQTALKAAQDGLKNAIRPIRNSVEIALAISLHRLGRTDEAIETLQTAIKDRNFWLATDWILLEHMLFKLLKEQSRLGELEAAILAGIKHRETHFTPEHSFTLVAKARYANWLIEQNQLEKVESLIPACQSLAEHPDATEQRRELGRTTLVQIYEALGLEAEADRWRESPKAE